MTETGLILGQEKIHENTDEIPTFQQMLEFLNLELSSEAQRDRKIDFCGSFVTQTFSEAIV